MLTSLSIRDVVLIDRLMLSFPGGLSVLTGETGAGKSILLDALGLALGARADSALVRETATSGQAAVTAEFDLPDGHPACRLLAEQGLETPETGEPLVLRRTVTADGRSRAYVNDQPIGVALLRDLGDRLVEIEGQFARGGLLNPAAHRAALDEFAGLADSRALVADAHDRWRTAEAELAESAARLEKAKAEEDYLRHVAAELDALDPQPGEEAHLAEQRAAMMNAERLTDALGAALDDITGEDGAETRLGRALRSLSRRTEGSGGILDAALAALERAADETAEASARLNQAVAAVTGDSASLEEIEERLFALRAAARKHRTDVDRLAELRERFAQSLAALDSSESALRTLQEAATARRTEYRAAAEKLSGARHEAAAALDAAVMAELPPLKLENARFRTAISPLEEGEWGRDGMDRVAFEVATNPGQAPGPLTRVASGGELARFTLALKVALRGANPVPTLVFDEVDSGIGGATAAAVGERLHRLAESVQVLVVTHSPQVAARGAAHWRVAKGGSGDESATVTEVRELTPEHRQEEIARMLAGAQITDEARAAAARLMGDAAG